MSKSLWGFDIIGDKWQYVTIEGMTADNVKLLRYILGKKFGRKIRITRKEFMSLFGMNKRPKEGSRLFLKAAKALMSFRYSYDDGYTMLGVNVLSGIEWTACQKIIREIVFFFGEFSLTELEVLLSHKNGKE